MIFKGNECYNHIYREQNINLQTGQHDLFKTNTGYSNVGSEIPKLIFAMLSKFQNPIVIRDDPA